MPSLRTLYHTIRHPPAYLIASLITTLGGLLNGLDTGTIGPVTSMPSFRASFGPLSPTMQGLVISSVLLPATFASLFSGAVSDSLGRTRVLALGGLVFAVGAGLEAGSQSLGILIAGRGVVGMGEGLFLSTLVVYVCEIAPPNKRGPLATMVQLLITVGLCLGYFTCYGTVNIPSSLSWRLPLALQSGIALFLAFAAHFYLPPSPRWLAYKGRKEEASLAWDKLGVSNAEREKDLLQNPPSELEIMPDGSVAEAAPAAKLKFWSKVRADFADFRKMFGRDARKPMFLGVFMMAMQQLSGIDGVIYYAPLLFQQAGLSSSSASFLASGISAILIFVFTILAVYFADRWSRRTSTIGGGLLLFACMMLMGLLYATNSVHATYGIGRWVVIVTIYVFAITYSTTWAIGVKLFASEIQPVATRATATSLAQAANCITNFFVAFITPVILAQSSSGVYFLFAGATIFTVAVCMVYMPETRGRDLETIGQAFGLHRTADMPLARGLRCIKSGVQRMVRAGSTKWRHVVPEVDTRAIELETL